MNEVKCPVCGSHEYTTEQEVFNPGCGCLGALLFGWWGLLLGLLGANDTNIVCLRCGHKWKPGGAPASGCLIPLVFIGVFIWGASALAKKLL